MYLLWRTMNAQDVKWRSLLEIERLAVTRAEKQKSGADAEVKELRDEIELLHREVHERDRKIGQLEARVADLEYRLNRAQGDGQ